MVLLVLCALPLAAQTPQVQYGKTVFVSTNNGFDVFIEAGFFNKHVPLKIVSSPRKADYVLDSVLFHSNQPLADVTERSPVARAESAVKLTDQKTGVVVWAYEVTKGSGPHMPVIYPGLIDVFSSRGKQSVSEAIAKHLRWAIDSNAKATGPNSVPMSELCNGLLRGSRVQTGPKTWAYCY